MNIQNVSSSRLYNRLYNRLRTNRTREREREREREHWHTEHDDADEAGVFAERIRHGDGVLARVLALGDRDVNLRLLLVALLLNLSTASTPRTSAQSHLTQVEPHVEFLSTNRLA